MALNIWTMHFCFAHQHNPQNVERRYRSPRGGAINSTVPAGSNEATHVPYRLLLSGTYYRTEGKELDLLPTPYSSENSGNPLKVNGNLTHHMFSIKKSCILRKKCTFVCVTYNFQNKQLLFPHTAPVGWSLSCSIYPVVELRFETLVARNSWGIIHSKFALQDDASNFLQQSDRYVQQILFNFICWPRRKLKSHYIASVCH
jgi:hypothetical protein